MNIWAFLFLLLVIEPCKAHIVDQHVFPTIGHLTSSFSIPNYFIYALLVVVCLLTSSLLPPHRPRYGMKPYFELQP